MLFIYILKPNKSLIIQYLVFKFVLKITLIDNILIPRHYFTDYLIIKLRIFIKDMLIHNRVCFIYTAYTFHVILNYTGLANLFLMDEWLYDNVVLTPEVKNVRHHLIYIVVYLHGAVICTL